MSEGATDAAGPLLPSDRVLLRGMGRVARPRWWALRPESIDAVEAQRLVRLVLAEAILANERAGLVALTEAADGLQARPVDARVPWPRDSVEAALLRARPMRVSQLVADWRGDAADPLAALTEAAVRRGVLRRIASRRRPALVPTPQAEAALAGEPATPRVETCPSAQPGLWRRLTAAIDEGFVLPPTLPPAPRPALDPRANAGVDRFGVPLGPPPGQAFNTTLLMAATMVAGMLALTRLGGVGWDPTSVLGWPRWPHVFGAVAALGLFVFARRPWRDEPLPPPGSPGEEEALAHRRRRRLARPDEPPPLPLRLLASAAMGVLVFILTALVSPVGVAVLALALGVVSWRSRAWYRLQRLMPSAREVELAVARRSRELMQRTPGTSERTRVPAARAPAAVLPRARRWLTPADLPPPSPVALALADRRRRVAAAAVRRHAFALARLVAGLAAVAIAWAWAGRTGASLIVAIGAVWLACLARVPGRLLHGLHVTRPQVWNADPGWTGRLLRGIAAVLPRSGTGRAAEAARTLRRRLAEAPDFWRDDTLDLAAPLGTAPRVLRGVTAVLGLLLATLALLGGHAELALVGAALLALCAASRVGGRREEPLGTEDSPVGLRLVLLRVFGSPSFDDLLARVRPWLLCGPVAHLEGYDSVARSAEVREALAAGHIDGVLVHSPEELAHRLAALPLRPDDNGRYRRQAFQCTDAIWRDAVRALLERADAVLMDLSDLGPEDMGCAYELGVLLDRVPLSRVLLLVDASTDLDCLDRVLDEAERRLAPDSPNRDDPDAAWRLLRTGGSAARQADEPRHDWLRRVDRQLSPLALVHFMLDGTCGRRAGGGHDEAPGRQAAGR